MTSLACLALLGGAVLSVWLTVFRFLTILTGLVILGAVAAMLWNLPVGQVLLASAAMYAATQVGYAVGLALQAVLWRDS